jgi:hypothetical protein
MRKGRLTTAGRDASIAAAWVSVAINALIFGSIGSAHAAPVFTGDIFFTTFNPTIPVPGSNVPANVGEVPYSYNGTTFSLGSITPIARTIGADGIVFDPNTGHLLVGGQGFDATAPVHEVNQNVAINGSNPSSNNVISVQAGSPFGAYHLSVSPDGKTVYAAGIPGGIGSVSLPLSSNGTTITVSGDVNGVDTLVFAAGKTFFSSSDAGGTLGVFGTIDLSTGVTTALIRDIDIHGMALDPLTGDIIAFGANTISQIDPTNPTVIKSQTSFSSPSPLTFDQGTVDGFGHAFVASNEGYLLFMDYSASDLVGDPSNFTSLPFLVTNLDDVAPLVGPGSSVPEPASLTLLGVAFLGMGWTRMRKKNG